MTTQQIPKSMRGIQAQKTGGPEVLEYKTDLPVPTPKEGEVLIKNEYSGVNFIEIYFRTGLYNSPKPEIPGAESAGTIVSTGSGEVYGFQPGDRVVSMAKSTHAEYSVAPAIKTFKLPPTIDNETAAASLIQGLTAWTLIRESYPVKKGDWVLVHAAAGGMGLWLCRLMGAIGARVIGTASSEEKRKLAKDNGAGWMLEYEDDNIKKGVEAITGGEGVAAVFDGVGKDTFEVDLEVLARKGTLVSFGSASGAVEPLIIARLGAKNLKVMRPSVFGYIKTREEFAGYCTEMFEFMSKEKIAPRIHDVYSLEQVQQAHKDLESRKTTGKLVIKI